MSVSTGAALLWILLLTFTVSTVSGAQKLTLTAEPGATINIRNNNKVKGCQVCTGSIIKKCSIESLNSFSGSTVSVELECSRPQDVFSIEIVRRINCTTKSCSGHIIQTDSNSIDVLRFNRTFTWNLAAAAPKAFQIDFTNTGLKQINPSEKCPDRHTYTLQAFQSTGNVAVGKYCRSGTISSAQILKSGSFSVDVPAEQKLQNDKFDVTVREKIKSLARISLTLPKGTSSSELLSPDYPESFPDDDIMEWYFQVPDKHGVDVQFLNLTQPDCVKKEVAVEYHQKGRVTSVLGLNETQPLQNHGDFLLTLRNCEMERAPADSPGLTFTLKVSASSPASTVPCKVDLSKTEGLSLNISTVTSTPDCVMKINSAKKDNITVTSSADLSFEDCFPGNMEVRATQVIDCSSGKCPDPVSLSVPLLPSCLPAPLSRVTWILRPGQHGTVKLISPTGPLKQSLPGQLCDDSVTIDVAEENGATIGTFCPNGAIQTVHIHTSVSVTWWSSMNAKAPRSAVLNASFEKEITERYIFTVSPKRDTPELVATPAWPAGMKAYSTVSWIVSVPPKMEAQLIFTKLSQPKCINRHTNIRVQRMGSPKEDYSRREDEVANSELTVSESFYLNMSNCLPERGNFSVITKISLQKSKGLLLINILSVVAALLVIFVMVLVVVCVVIRNRKKKKKKLNHEVSVYNPNGINFLPGYNGPPKTHEDDDAHVYTSIDDTLVYTHLLKKGADIGIYGETYQHFTGHTDSQKPLLSSQKGPPLPNRSPSQDQTLMDQSEDEQSSNLGPRLEPEGGN
ncbi:CUB domain-containing protein 1a isoform X4 [Simochromis diagramma]|uniref:CUB domain-containing protein 1a isoform X4 n=1 Tax=Simochromis diagramma TaxID=43689 RepID=UPI001A7E91F1|nr:CUB domain-containing protein 1a isoform X4 [Simochromis diagramma]